MAEPTSTPSGPSTAALPIYRSPTLASLANDKLPNPSPACESCPMSIWFTTSHELKCYCSRMNALIWTASADAILTCDGRELALAQLAGATEQT